MNKSAWILASLVLSSLVLSSCATPKAVMYSTPKPDVTQVRQSNIRLRSHIEAIQKSSQEAIKANKSIGGDIDSADAELKKLLP